MVDHDLSRLKIKKEPHGGRIPGKRKVAARVVAAVVAILIVGFLLKGRLAPAVEVETATVTQIYPSQTFTLLNASGYVVAQRRAAVSSKATGRLEWLGVEEGSRVKDGEIIARLENRDVIASRDQASAGLVTARSNLEQAKAEQKDATKNFERMSGLLAQGIVSQADYDVAEARKKRADAAVAGAESSVRQAGAALNGASVALDYTVIRAPFDGVVLTKNADVGDIVTPMAAAANAKAAVVTMADMDSLQVEVDVSEANLGKIRSGQPCEIQLDAFPESRFPGVVHTIVPTADRSKATVMVKVRFLEKDGRILPEMSAKVAFLERPVQGQETKPFTAVNSAALATADGRRVVYVMKGDRVSEAEVKTGRISGDMVEILSGLKPGEKVALRPLDKLKDGKRVKAASKE